MGAGRVLEPSGGCGRAATRCASDMRSGRNRDVSGEKRRVLRQALPYVAADAMVVRHTATGTVCALDVLFIYLDDSSVTMFSLPS